MYKQFVLNGSITMLNHWLLISLIMVKQCLQDNSPTNQLAVSQVADWITRGLVNSPTANF